MDQSSSAHKIFDAKLATSQLMMKRRKPDGHLHKTQSQRKITWYGKVVMFSRFAVHKKFEAIGALYAASFSGDE